MRMTIKANSIKTVMRKLEKDAKAAQKVLKATGADMKRRVPGKVADEVRAVYNIKKSEITPSGKKGAAKAKRKAGSVKVKGATVSQIEIVYSGRVLTPTHFGMRPKTLTKPTGRNRRRKPITAEIKKGQRKSLGSNVFLGSNSGGGYIPFKRKGKSRYPIQAVKTLSVPQMVDNRTVSRAINRDINQMLEQRLEHNLNRFMRR